LIFREGERRRYGGKESEREREREESGRGGLKAEMRGRREGARDRRAERDEATDGSPLLTTVANP